MKKYLGSYALNTIAVIFSFIITINLLKSGIISSYFEGILITAGINIILATSLNLTSGCLGELVLGHAGFMSIGAYTAALITMKWQFPETVKILGFSFAGSYIEFPIALLAGGLMAALFGLIIGIPALRLKGDYLAIITLGFGEIIRVIILNLNFTGGGRGLSGINNYTNVSWVFWIMILVIIILFTLMRSRQGRAILSIRENEIAAEAVGIHTTFYKIYAFTISSFFAGIAGGLYAHYITVIDPTTFGFMRSIEILVMVVLGGMGSFTGSILAAGTLTFLPELLREFNDYRMLIYSIVLVAVMIFKPEGLLGKYEFSLTRIVRRIIKRLSHKSSSTTQQGGKA